MEKGSEPLLCFLIGNKGFAVETRHVEKVIEGGEVFPLSMLPIFFNGFISYKRTLIPLLNCGFFFGEEGRGICIILKTPHGLLGLETNRVVGTGITLPVAEGNIPYTKGLAKGKKGSYRLLDMDAILSAILSG